MEMNLGEWDRSINRLSYDERLAVHQRVIAFTLFPGLNQEDYRLQHQAVYSAWRILRLDKKWDEQRHTPALKRCRDEEYNYFGSVGGWERVLYSPSLDQFEETLKRTLPARKSVARLALMLWIHSGDVGPQDMPGISKATAIFENYKKLTDKSGKNVKSKDNSIFLSGAKNLDRIWREYSSALHLEGGDLAFISHQFLAKPELSVDEKKIERVKSIEEVLALSLGLQAFLNSTKAARAGQIYVDRDKQWTFAPTLVTDIKPAPMLYSEGLRADWKAALKMHKQRIKY